MAPQPFDQKADRAAVAARTTLNLDAPFYGVLSMSTLQMVQDPTCDTAWTDGRRLGYNPEWFTAKPHAERVFVLAHEVEHVARKHHLRRGNRDAETWNVACDRIVNAALVRSGWQMPAEGLLVDMAEADLSAEELYARLLQEKQAQPQPPQGGGTGRQDQGQSGGKQVPQPGVGPGKPWNVGEVRDATDNGQALSPDEADQAAREVDIAVYQAATIAKRRGKLPGHMARLLEDLTPKADPWEILRRFASEACQDDYSWHPPNRRYVGQDLYLPSLRSDGVGEGWLIMDTSGSCYSVLPEFGAHMAAIAEAHNIALNVLYVDAKVQGDAQRIEPGEPFALEARGGGGTDFRPPFVWLAERNIRPNWLVYFTDLEGIFPPTDPGFPVLWAQIGRGCHDVPFGEVVGLT